MRGVLDESSGLVGEGEYPGGAKASGEPRLCFGLNRRRRVSDLRVEQHPEVEGVSLGFVICKAWLVMRCLHCVV
jgi:hypothetical protein